MRNKKPQSNTNTNTNTSIHIRLPIHWQLRENQNKRGKVKAETGRRSARVRCDTTTVSLLQAQVAKQQLNKRESEGESGGTHVALSDE